MIADKGYCGHVSGEDPFHCNRTDVTSQSLCEDYCTAMASCVAYNYNIKHNDYNNCNLIPSDANCPSGWSALNRSGPKPASMIDLQAVFNLMYVCYGKVSVHT